MGFSFSFWPIHPVPYTSYLILYKKQWGTCLSLCFCSVVQGQTHFVDNMSLDKLMKKWCYRASCALGIRQEENAPTCTCMRKTKPVELPAIPALTTIHFLAKAISLNTTYRKYYFAYLFYVLSGFNTLVINYLRKDVLRHNFAIMKRK